MRILLVDDDTFLRDMYAVKFSGQGYDIDTASGGAQALAKLETDSAYDVVLLDMIMPGMSGVELISAIKEAFGDNAPRCIVLSNQGQEADIAEAKAAGAAGYIIKAEAIPSEVVERVKSIISK